MAKLAVGREINVLKSRCGRVLKEHTLEILEVDNKQAKSLTLGEPDGTEWTFNLEDLKALVAMFKE